MNDENEVMIPELQPYSEIINENMGSVFIDEMLSGSDVNFLNISANQPAEAHSIGSVSETSNSMAEVR